MSKSDDAYLASLREHASQARMLFSNMQKAERERMVARAFLRCVGVKFVDPEIKASTEEPVDVFFRGARFQVRDIVGDRKRGKDWADRQRNYKQAHHAADLREPWIPSEPIALSEMSADIAQALAEKASRYGLESCTTLDALVYVDLKGRHMFPLTPGPDDDVVAEFERQGWRSVSFVFLPYGVVLIARPDAPDLLRDRAGLALNNWPRPDGWFEP